MRKTNHLRDERLRAQKKLEHALSALSLNAAPDRLDLHSESSPAPSRPDESGTHSPLRRWKRSLGRGKS